MTVTFSLFQSLCSSDDVYRPISGPYISTCYACSALLFGPKMNLPKTYKLCKKRNYLMRINRVITVLPFSRPNFHKMQCKIYYPFSPGRLAPNPLTFFMYVAINNLRMRMYLQRRRCFPLPAIGVKRFIYKMFGGPYCTCYSIDNYHILHACWNGCQLIELLRFYRLLALISIGCNVKLMTRFHQDALPRIP